MTAIAAMRVTAAVMAPKANPMKRRLVWSAMAASGVVVGCHNNPGGPAWFLSLGRRGFAQAWTGLTLLAAPRGRRRNSAPATVTGADRQDAHKNYSVTSATTMPVAGSTR